MMSDIALFFSEQDELLNRPEEDFSTYLARRQRSRTDESYKFDAQIISVNYPSSVDLSPLVSKGSEIRRSTPESLALGSSASPHDPPTISGENFGFPLAKETPSPISKRKADDAGSDSNQRPGKKFQGDAERVASRSNSRALNHHGAEQNTKILNLVPAQPSSPVYVMTPRLSHQADFAAREPEDAASANLGSDNVSDFDPRRTEEKNCALLLGPPALPTDPSNAGCQQTIITKRPIRKGTPIIAPERVSRPIAGAPDSSNITTPPNTAPGTVSSLAKGVINSGKGAKKGNGTTAAQRQKGKKKKELITPLEYAKRIQAQWSERPLNGRKPAKPFLRDKYIFYYGGDLNYAGTETRRKMEIIVKHGGTLVPQYDPKQMTHIITDASKNALLIAIGAKKLADIPQHIPTVKWSWVLSGLDRAPVKRSSDNLKGGKGKAPQRDDNVPQGDSDEYEYPMDGEYDHASFPERIDAGETPWQHIQRMRSEYAARKNVSKVRAQPVAGGSRNADAVGSGSTSVDDISHISDFTQDKVSPAHEARIPPHIGPPLPSPPSEPRLGDRPKPHELGQEARVKLPSGHSASTGHSGASTSNPLDPPSYVDPLAEFYALARAERHTEMFGDDEAACTSILPSEKEQGPSRHRQHGNGEAAKKGQFLCDDKGGRQLLFPCPNQDVIDKLEELKGLHDTKRSEDDHWRVLGLNKAIAALRKHPTRIRTAEEATKLRGVGEKTAQKIMEIVETGALRRIGYEMTEGVTVIRLFTGIYGVGGNIARIWYNNGCRTLEDVAARKGGIKLSHAQEIGLRYYKDINTRIPRAEVQEIYNLVKAEALRIDPKLFIEVMGSFRRGKDTCGDIDVFITRPTEDGNTHRGVLRRLLAELHKQGVITEDLHLPDDFEDLELVYRGLCRRDPQSLQRRIDFLTVPWTSRGAALLYYTGDDIFNRSLRLKANKMGYSLNQRGLYADVIRNKERQKVTEGKLVASESEKEIFDILGVPWQEPHERVRS